MVVPILRWMFVLVLLLAVAGGGTAYWFYSRSDEGLRQMVLRQLELTAPGLKFQLVRAQWDLIGRVQLYGLTIRLPEDDDERPSIEIPRIEATLESRTLTDFENIVIQKLRVVNPKLRVIRSADGAWNLGELTFASAATGPLPEIEIEHGVLQVEVQLPHRPTRRLKFQNLNASVAPTASRRLAIQVATLLEPAGPLTLDINVNLDGPKWECVSHEPWRVPIDSKLIQLLSDLSPEIALQVDKGAEWIEKAKLMQKRAVEGTQSAIGDPASTIPATANVTDFGLRCLCNLTCQISQNGPDEPVEFRALAAISEGHITNDLLPISMHDLRGNILIDNRQIIVSNVQASNGPTQLLFDGDIIPSKPIQGVMKLRGIELNDELKARLPESLRKIVIPLGLTGHCEADVTVTHDQGSWQPEIDLRLMGGTVTDKRFPVTVRKVAGELHLRKNILTFTAQGKYANQPVTVEGTVTNPGPAHQAEIVLKGRNLPLDDESVAACPLAVQRTIKALNLNGRHDLWLRLSKPAGVGQKYKPELVEKLSDGRLTFSGFPYEIQQLQGFLKWSGDDVEFTKLTGTHNGTTIAGRGIFRRHPGADVLELAVDANDGAFDRSLKEALPAKLRQIWNDFQPNGLFDIKTRITWIPGQPCDIEIPSITVRGGEVVMRSFPWPLQNLRGEFAFSTKTGQLEMKELYAEHDETQLSGSGFGTFPSTEPWRLKFDLLPVDHLLPNLAFRNTLPAGIQRVYDSLLPKGDFSFSGPVEFSGPSNGDDAMEVAWNLKTVLSHCALNVGTPIKDINGFAQLVGTWNGTQAHLDGELNLDSISLFQQRSGLSYQITGIRGPFSFHQNKFIAGTTSAIPPRKGLPVAEKRISGKAVGGTVYLDAVVDVESDAEYRVFVELEKGLLERYAQQYLHGQSNLAGVMNGWLNLRGKGDSADRMEGEGKLRIAPASLYELPLFVQMFNLPQLRVPDKTAFEQADLDFSVVESRFDFRSIELLGDAMSLRGRGYVRFDGELELEFGSRPGRGRRRMLQNLFMQAEWIAVRVTGNVGNPHVAYIPLPDLDDAMRQFFNPRPMGSGQMRALPRTGQSPTTPSR